MLVVVIGRIVICMLNEFMREEPVYLLIERRVQ